MRVAFPNVIIYVRCCCVGGEAGLVGQRRVCSDLIERYPGGDRTRPDDAGRIDPDNPAADDHGME